MLATSPTDFDAVFDGRIGGLNFRCTRRSDGWVGVMSNAAIDGERKGLVDLERQGGFAHHSVVTKVCKLGLHVQRGDQRPLFTAQCGRQIG